MRTETIAQAPAPAAAPAAAGAGAAINALSLDAVAVALLWQTLFLRAFSDRWPRPPEALALGLVVWLIYAGDRWLDARRLDPAKPHLLRHRLHAEHAGWLALVWAAALLAAVAVAAGGLEPRLLGAGCVLAALVLLYALRVHGPASPPRGWTKELRVGLLFAAGVALPCASEVPSFPLALAVVLAGLLFGANCLVVTAREAAADADAKPPRAGLARRLLGLVALGGAGGLACGVLPGLFAVPLLAGAAALAPLAAGACRPAPLRPTGGHGRALLDPGGWKADAALLVPPAAAALAWGWLKEGLGLP
ncbi:hypothetical protein [Phycisphaera mikurensis]|uniref:UbiA prenyltransferase family protein n=1 Tax=Phycisphaera mikurensis (strain NBRC 102666 / KCTC 22515 / FYK2301M01) TaxID=1142394 RepID=I0IGM1_PHYMF|nr:hypothetical protein [Phycisphaera mikurensis]MBB6442909.1 hypothetical protein [Phycisphaera mikurensis]BAM04409.1 hypothetical protein PSMK_22500 [Phycisphaera mikurensis NBRC 102666]